MAILREISFLYTFKNVDDDILNQTLDSPEKVYQVFEHLKHETKERFIVVNLTSQHSIINYETVAIGTVNNVSLRPAEVLRSAIMINAPAIILVHNHPSGNPKPSQSDIHFTEKIKQAAEHFNIDVLDHVIIGLDSFARAK
ncbi:MAG: JAB domain-containing protein [Cognaticolwellia aestuarii]